MIALSVGSVGIFGLSVVVTGRKIRALCFDASVFFFIRLFGSIETILNLDSIEI